MENNIFKGAKFGDKFICKNGSIAIFHRAFMKLSYYLIVSEICDRIEYNSDGTCRGDSEWDIVSRYQEPINEDKLEDFATLYMLKNGRGSYYDLPFQKEAYKAGYRKAKEE